MSRRILKVFRRKRLENISFENDSKDGMFRKEPIVYTSFEEDDVIEQFDRKNKLQMDRNNSAKRHRYRDSTVLSDIGSSVDLEVKDKPKKSWSFLEKKFKFSAPRLSTKKTSLPTSDETKVDLFLPPDIDKVDVVSNKSKSDIEDKESQSWYAFTLSSKSGSTRKSKKSSVRSLSPFQNTTCRRVMLVLMLIIFIGSLLFGGIYLGVSMF